MLFAVLRMPLDLAMGDELSRFQFHQRALEAADRIEALEAQVAAAHEAGYELAKKEALQSGWHLRRYDLAKRDDDVGKP
jgi:hypothetical protein